MMHSNLSGFLPRFPSIPVLLFIMMLGFFQTNGLAADSQGGSKVFPYEVYKETLGNGLDIIIIPTPEFKDVLSYNTLVLSGARNEVDPGKTGLAHLFEHILFRHKYKGEVNGYDTEINRLGAHNNAWTWFDVTYYHPLTFVSNFENQTVETETFPGILELESSRFTSLNFDEEIFKTETGAVLGEYRRNYANPVFIMSEKLFEIAYKKHSYGHTTMGYYDDVVDMPNEYRAAVEFYDNYYRPTNCVIVVTGDVDKDYILDNVKKYYSDWKRKDFTPAIVAEPPQTKEIREHVSWEADVPPRILLAYRVPAYKTGDVETAVGQLLPELLVSESAPLYQKLRYEKKTVSSLSFYGGTSNYESFDPRLLVFSTQMYKEMYEERGKDYIEEVITDINQACQDLKKFSSQENVEELLNVLKSKYKYDFLSAMSSPADIAQNFAWYYRFERDPNVFDHLIESVQNVRPEDVENYAKKYFVSKNRTLVTLTHDEKTSSAR